MMNVGTLEGMPLDFKTPFDELSELRTLLTTQEIAELTGLRRETISRARPDRRFQRRTEKALGDLYLVVTRMRSVAGPELVQLAAVLRRPQASLEQRSIADLVKEGRVDAVLEHLAPPQTTVEEDLANVRLAPEVEAGLTSRREPTGDDAGEDQALTERVSVLLAANPDLDSRLDAIEVAICGSFGPEVVIDRAIISDRDAPEGRDELYLRVNADLQFEEKVDRLAELLRREENLLAPVRRQLTIGFL